MPESRKARTLSLHHVVHAFSRRLHVIGRGFQTWACVEHRYYDNATPGNLRITRKMADRHTISVVGLLKDAEFHMIKGAVEVIFNIKSDTFLTRCSMKVVWSSYLIYCMRLLHQQLSQRDPDVFTEPYVLGLLECDWDTFIRDKKKVWYLEAILGYIQC